MLQLNPKTTVATPQAPATEKRQPRRLQIALALLVMALAVTIARDRDFWFGTGAEDSDVLGPEVTHQSAKSAVPSAAPSVPTSGAKKQAVAQKPAGTNAPESSIVASNRTVVPPLDVEVVAGDTHHTIHPGNNATKVEIGNAASALQSSKPLNPATNAAEREQISTALQPQQSLEANYPLLAQQMKVQGSVVLQALIGADGVIQDIHVLSGPSILASAAQQAVRQWRFKPYLENGQAVETQAKITVNFTIKVADNSPRNS
ncbi:MAG TPA: energy transducer TonB [Candidatus Acidoferrales bacterium]|nr:energy transducer TonB [Candidatus Acidoferrales bacterium]